VLWCLFTSAPDPCRHAPYEFWWLFTSALGPCRPVMPPFPFPCLSDLSILDALCGIEDGTEYHLDGDGDSDDDSYDDQG
jgi:hypothetical protein